MPLKTKDDNPCATAVSLADHSCVFGRLIAGHYPKWNFNFSHDPRQWAKLAGGLTVTLKLSVRLFRSSFSKQPSSTR
ncbi:MAG: hypothetical protein ACK4RZ_17410 [Paracoccaceae bacterium]